MALGLRLSLTPGGAALRIGGGDTDLRAGDEIGTRLDSLSLENVLSGRAASVRRRFDGLVSSICSFCSS
jgi:hypothetical protein